MMSQGVGGEDWLANLGQPADHLSVAPANGLGQEAAQTASIGKQLQPDACREEKVGRR